MFCERLREAVRIQQPIRARCKHGLCHGYAIELYHSSRTTEWRLAARLLKLNQHDLGIRPDAYRQSPPFAPAGGKEGEGAHAPPRRRHIAVHGSHGLRGEEKIVL